MARKKTKPPTRRRYIAGHKGPRPLGAAFSFRQVRFGHVVEDPNDLLADDPDFELVKELAKPKVETDAG